jgi:hypothetical protein
MILCDATGRIIHINKAWTQLTGYELQDVEGMTNKILHGDETEREYIEQYRHAFHPHSSRDSSNASSERASSRGASSITTTLPSQSSLSVPPAVSNPLPPAPTPTPAPSSSSSSMSSVASQLTSATNNNNNQSPGITTPSFQMIVTNYTKSKRAFLNHVIIVPIYGGYLQPGITHYCAYCKELPWDYRGQRERYEELMEAVRNNTTTTVGRESSPMMSQETNHNHTSEEESMNKEQQQQPVANHGGEYIELSISANPITNACTIHVPIVTSSTTSHHQMNDEESQIPKLPIPIVFSPAFSGRQETITSDSKRSLEHNSIATALLMKEDEDECPAMKKPRKNS